MNILETIETLKLFLGKQITSLANNNPLIAFAQPVISKVVNNKLNNMQGFLSMLADESGEIDTKTLVSEMVQNVMTTKPFVYHTDILGDLEIGGGFIKINIPMTNNQLVLGRNDLEELKQLFNAT
jgi:small basic protein